MKLYLLKTGYACCPDGDWVVGLFTDLDKLREAICITADKLWAYKHIAYDPCGKAPWYLGDEDTPCDRQCENCEYFYSRERYEKHLRQQKEKLLYPFENVYVEVWESDCASFIDDCDDHVSITYVLRPSSPENRTSLVSELFGEEVYHYELPPELQAIK